MDLLLIEAELKKRLVYPYQWGQKQNNQFDKQTRFIYSIFYFNKLLDRIEQQFSHLNDYASYFNYALNRWYNFWSAKAARGFCHTCALNLP